MISTADTSSTASKECICWLGAASWTQNVKGHPGQDVLFSTWIVLLGQHRQWRRNALGV